MKLIDLLHEHLKAWPDDDCVAITQDGYGGVYYWQKTPVFDEGDDDWNNPVGSTMHASLLDGEDYFLLNESGDNREFTQCEDYKTAIITREQFEAHKMKPDDIIPTAQTTCTLIEMRDRIIEIEKQQLILQNEKRDLYSKISQSGFKLDLGAMK